GGTTVLPSASPVRTPTTTPGRGAAALTQGYGSGGIVLDAAPSPAARRVAAQGFGSSVLGGALPFTGAPLAVLLLLGGGAVAGGAAALRAGRRRGAQVS
ncbi:MAG: hypothetical protein JWM64_1026, partial [Frankiales bacterium]|nr:hypothetical protein [Frankiales bacterium]